MNRYFLSLGSVHNLCGGQYWIHMGKYTPFYVWLCIWNYLFIWIIGIILLVYISVMTQNHSGKVWTTSNEVKKYTLLSKLPPPKKNDTMWNHINVVHSLSSKYNVFKCILYIQRNIHWLRLGVNYTNALFKDYIVIITYSVDPKKYPWRKISRKMNTYPFIWTPFPILIYQIFVIKKNVANPTTQAELMNIS